MWNLKHLNLRCLQKERLYQHKIHLENLLSAKSNLKTKGPKCPSFLANQISLKDFLSIQAHKLNYDNLVLYKQLKFFSSFSPYSKDNKKMIPRYCPALDKVRFNFDKIEREREINKENINFFNRFSSRKSKYEKKNYLKKNYYEQYLRDNINRNNLPNPNLEFCTFDQFKNKLRKKGLQLKKLSQMKDREKERVKSSSRSKEKEKHLERLANIGIDSNISNSDRFWKYWSPPPIRTFRCESAFPRMKGLMNIKTRNISFLEKNNIWDEEFIKSFKSFSNDTNNRNNNNDINIYSSDNNKNEDEEEKNNKTLNERINSGINFGGKNLNKKIKVFGGIINNKYNLKSLNSPRINNLKTIQRSRSSFGERFKQN